jgi:hypothetical protein
MKTNKYKKNTKRLSKEPHKKTRYLRKKNTKRISKKPHKKTRYNKFTKKYKGGTALTLPLGVRDKRNWSPVERLAKRRVQVSSEFKAAPSLPDDNPDFFFKYNTFEYLVNQRGTHFDIHIISNLEHTYNTHEDKLLELEIKYYGKIESNNDILKSKIHEFVKSSIKKEITVDDSIQLYYTKLKIHQNEKYNEQFKRTRDHLEACKAAAAISKLGGLGDPYDSEEYQTQMDNFYKIEMIIELLKITIKLYRVFIKYFFFKNRGKSNIQSYLDSITSAAEDEKQTKITQGLTFSLDVFSLNDPYDESSYPNEEDEIYLGTNIYTYNKDFLSIENYINYLSANILNILGRSNDEFYNIASIISIICNPKKGNLFDLLYNELERELS